MNAGITSDRPTGRLHHRRAQLEALSREELIKLVLAVEGYSTSDTDMFRQPMVLRPLDPNLNWQPDRYTPLPVGAESGPGWRMVVVSFDLAHPVVGIDLRGEIVVGRGGRNPGLAHDCDWDLTNFDAASYGVSRQHALFRAVENGLQVVDLESRNGTRLDGRLLDPFEPEEIRESGTLMFGALELQVRLAGQVD